MSSPSNSPTTDPNSDFDKRAAESRRILAKYPDRIPVICDKHPKAYNLPDIEKKKFLVPDTMLVGQFKYIIHKHINWAGNNENSQNSGLGSDQTIYLFVGSGNVAPKTGALLSEVYDSHKSGDGFLYITYSAENTLGKKEKNTI